MVMWSVWRLKGCLEIKLGQTSDPEYLAGGSHGQSLFLIWENLATIEKSKQSGGNFHQTLCRECFL